MINLKIDPEFQNQIPPLTDDEYKQLEENILKEGKLLSPLIVWNNTLVDDGLFSCVSCYCRTFVALSSDTINRIQEPARTVHTTGRARHTPAGNEGITKRSPPARRGIWA